MINDPFLQKHYADELRHQSGETKLTFWKDLLALTFLFSGLGFCAFALMMLYHG